MKRLLLAFGLLLVSSVASAQNFSFRGPNNQYGFGSFNGNSGYYMQGGRMTQFWVQPNYSYPVYPIYRPYVQPYYVPYVPYRAPQYSYGSLGF